MARRGRSTAQRSGPALVKGLGLGGATSLVVGIVIGSGIFRTPDLVAQEVGTTGLVLLVWVVAGVLVLFGALSYAELGAMMPQAGGAYVYMREAYGPLLAFLTGWVSFVSNNTAALAAVAVFFGELFADVFGLAAGWVPVVAASAVLLLTAANVLGVRVGGGIQIGFTALKLGALAAIVLLGLALADRSVFVFTPLWPTEFEFGLVTAFGVAMVGALFTYDGWTNANNVAEEIQDPGRTLPRALLSGVLLVMGVYVLANVVYLFVLSPGGLAGAEGRTAARTMDAVVGEGGARFVTVAILVSLFGTLNGQCLAYPRIYFAMARDRLFFARAAEVHPRFRTPHFSLLIQAAVAIAFIVFYGAFEDLIALVIFSAWIFYALAVGAVFVLRRKRPDLPRPYKAWGYPVLPALFILAAAAFALNLLFELREQAFLALAIILAGVPVYYGWLAWRKRARA